MAKMSPMCKRKACVGKGSLLRRKQGKVVLGEKLKQGKAKPGKQSKSKPGAAANVVKFWSGKALKGLDKRNITFWRKQKDNLIGVTGGGINNKDLAFSKSFVQNHLLRYAPRPSGPSGKINARRFRRSLDAGAGIGRVTEGLLQTYSDHVDMMDPIKKLQAKARAKLGAGKKNGCKFGYICSTLQAFKPAKQIYDLVWCQWTLMYVSDTETVQFLRKVGSALATDARGVIVVKENIPSPGEESFFDSGDVVTEKWTADGSGSSKPPMSCCRTAKHHEVLFKQAGLEILKKQLQNKGLGDDNDMVTYILGLKNK